MSRPSSLDMPEMCLCVFASQTISEFTNPTSRDVGVQGSGPFDDVADRVDDDVGA